MADTGRRTKKWTVHSSGESRNRGPPPRQSRDSSYGRFNDTEPIEKRDVSKELVERMNELGITDPTNKCNKLFVLTSKDRKKYEESYKRVMSSGLTLDGKRVVLMAQLCADGEEHVATDLLPIAKAGMVNAEGLVPSSMVLGALKEAMEPDGGRLCALLGDDRV
eukprot:6192664-Pleurochrysis_carterae.AAC.1